MCGRDFILAGISWISFISHIFCVGRLLALNGRSHRFCRECERHLKPIVRVLESMSRVHAFDAAIGRKR